MDNKLDNLVDIAIIESWQELICPKVNLTGQERQISINMSYYDFDSIC